jgi:cytochrome c oxidase assembly protein subunit 15
LKQISPAQKRPIDLSKTMKWMTIIVFGITFYQMFLGTQVREYIDELTKMGYSRDSWTEQLGMTFYIHRTFSWLVLIVMTYMVWKNEKSHKHMIIRSAYIILALELVSGVLLAYANMPGLIQTSHLIFATILFGVLLMMIFRIRTVK